MLNTHNHSTETPARILIVEDESVISTHLTRTLHTLGYEITAVRSGEQALESIDADPPDLVLMDIKLSGSLDGIDTAARIQTRYALPVIYLTAHSKEHLIQRSKPTKPYGYLLKPYRERELRAAIETALYKHTMERRLYETQQHLEQEIVERTRAEAALQKAYDELDTTVLERTQELREVNERLLQEITEHQRTNAALRTTERQYQSLVEHVADGIGIIQDGRFVFVNPALPSILRYPPSFLTGASPAVVFPDQYAGYFTHADHCPEWEMIEIEMPEAPEIRWLEGHRVRITWDGRPAIMVTLRDITERKRRERAMQAEKTQLHSKLVQLHAAMKERYRLGEIIGKSAVMQRVYELVMKAAATDAPVVIYGESGTGKELAALTIHNLSHRHLKPFVPVNCGGIPENLMEREFFGHRKGAFTGAHQDLPGYLAAAHTGTIFLDEISELTLAMQVKLLRAIDGKGYIPVGDQRVCSADVRIIAADHKNLLELVQHGDMREDFFYRMHVLQITLPPLRARKDDIPLLVDHFFAQHDTVIRFQDLPQHIVAALLHYHWPGNVRELQNALRQYLALQRLDFFDTRQNEAATRGGDTDSGDANMEELPLHEALAHYEKHLILRTLERNHWHRTNTAAKLGISRRHLLRKLKRYGLA